MPIDPQAIANLNVNLQDLTKAVRDEIDALKKVGQGSIGGQSQGLGGGGGGAAGGGGSGGSDTAKSPQDGGLSLSLASRLATAAAPSLGPLGSLASAAASGGPAGALVASVGLVGAQIQQMSQENATRGQVGFDAFANAPIAMSQEQAERRANFETQRSELRKRIKNLNDFAEGATNKIDEGEQRSFDFGLFSVKGLSREEAAQNAQILSKIERESSTRFERGDSAEQNALSRTRSELRLFIESGGLKTEKGRAAMEARLRLNLQREHNSMDAIEPMNESLKKLRPGAQHVQGELKHG